MQRGKKSARPQIEVDDSATSLVSSWCVSGCALCERVGARVSVPCARRAAGVLTRACAPCRGRLLCRLDDMKKERGGAVAPDGDDEGEPADAAAAPRPARLGLGAKFIPHSAALDTRDIGAAGNFLTISHSTLNSPAFLTRRHAQGGLKTALCSKPPPRNHQS